jgi:riboflavin kinase/FMN adenylyltransferase
VTIGVFDGVHRGHQQIIGRAVESARRANQPAVVVTFDPHPSEVVRPGSHPPVLTTQRYKAELLDGMGVDVMCVLPFTLDFSRLSPDAFVHEVLVEALHASAVVIGENFRYGHRAAGDLSTLEREGRMFGFAAEGVPLLREGDLTISSTYVRTCVAGGDVSAAAQAMGRPHRVEGVIVRGDGRGRAIGFPTANIETAPHAAIPADGVYAGWLVRGREPQHLPGPEPVRTPAAISVGTNPTFEGRERRVEAYLLDFDGDLYGDHVAVEFIARLRDMERFDRVEDLLARMDGDVSRTRDLLVTAPSAPSASGRPADSAVPYPEGAGDATSGPGSSPV